MCGIIGLYLKKPVVSELYEGLFMIQHRGQDQAGIYTFDDHKIHKRKGKGLVDDIFDYESLKRLKGNVGIGHVRYPTIGGGGAGDAQPFSTDHPYGIMMAHNGNITNHHELKKELIEKDLRFVNSDCDVEVILKVFADGLRKQKLSANVTPENIWKAVEEVFKRVLGAYSVVCHIAHQGMVVFRDPYGIRPAIWGTRKRDLIEEHCFCSENVVLDYLGFDVKRDVRPGEVIFIDKNDKVHTKDVMPKKQHLCIFEYIYFARPDAVIDQISVQKARYRMGQKLAPAIKKAGIKIDSVVPVPDSSRWAAIGLAKELGIDYREGLVKHRYVGRTFIMPGQNVRKKSIRRKFTPNIYELKNKNILLVDDSIVRGNTSKKIINLVRESGAKKVYMASVAPPLTSPCPYGIDLASKKEYIANDFSIEDIRKNIGADALFYQELDQLIEACAPEKHRNFEFCTACFNGKYPTSEMTEEKLQAMEKIRDVELCRVWDTEDESDSQLSLI